uniref:Ig-like domain-containing protein n=1 Tax=Fundulus heteroclitus TaxID=8078 RepID=A0A3Q2QD39_FUNHE
MGVINFLSKQMCPPSVLHLLTLFTHADRPKTCTVSVTPSGQIEEGKPVDLTCMSDANPAAEYTWYKENKILPDASKQVYHFHTVSSDDRGSYFCSSKNQYGHLESSPLFLDVPSASITPGEIMEGSSVTLTCSSDANPAAQYTWYRENEHKPLGEKENFIFNSIDSSESGEYYCTALNSRGKKTSLRVDIDCQRSLSESQEDVQYASIQFLRKQRDPVYANFKPAKPRTSDEEEEEEQDVEYTTVKFASTSCGHR